MKSTRKLAQIFLFLSITTSFVFATIHEDEIGVYDWYKENVGEILTADYYVTPSKKNVIVSTDENVIAAISLKSGEIVWRQVLFDDETLQSFETKGNIAFTLSHSSKTNLYSLRYWDVTDGSLLWDDTLAVTTAAASLHYDDVIIVTNNFIQLKSSKDGNAIWTKERTLKSTKLPVIQSFPQEFIVVSVSGNNADILSFNAKDGNLKKEQQVSFPANFEVKEIEIVNDLVVILGNQQNLLTYKLSGNSGSFTPLSNEKLVVTEGSHLESHSSQVFTLQNKFNSIIFKLKNDQVEILHQSQKKAFSVSLTEENTILYASIITDNSIEIIDLSTKKSQIVPIFDLGNHGNVKRSFLNMFTPKKENAATSYRLLVITQDNCATLLTEGTVTWQREESLASVVKAEIMDLPSSHVFDSIAHTIDEDVTINFISGFVVRVTAQIQQLIETLTGKSSKVINEDLLIKDRFGFKQLVLLSTKVGKLFALHTEKGQVVWSRFLPGVQISNIMVTRTAAFYPPELLVTGNKVNEYSELYWINPLNGQVNKQEFLSFKISQAVKLSQHDHHGNHYVMLVENSAKVHVYPNNAESISFFKNHNFTLFFYSVDLHDNQVNGYMIDQQIDNTNQFTVINVWAVPFSTGETIAAVAHSNWNEQVYAPARILGDRSALPKYINKNMVAIATTKTSQEDSVLSIYLIDTVTGNLVHNSYHSRAGGPVHLVLSDNWVLYHYWNTQHKRFEFSVLEIFEKEIDWKGTTYSSFDKIPELNILQKAFVFSNNLRTMSVSTTTHGITPKQLLVGLETGQIIALPKSFLDPRRPPKAEYLPEHREEGLIPYHHTILPSPKSYINYYKKISKLNKIVTAPSTLESTCLVFAFGLDNFYTRIAPSGTFDLLNPDFNYVALIITSIVISVLTVFSMWLSKKRQLQKLWN